MLKIWTEVLLLNRKYHTSLFPRQKTFFKFINQRSTMHRAREFLAGEPTEPVNGELLAFRHDEAENWKLYGVIK